MTLIYRIVTAEEWRALEASGSFTGAAHDARDGFIHLSAAQQIAGTLAAHYPARAGLWLLAIRTELLAAAPGKLTWEASRGRELFPHFYGAVPLEVVVSATAIALDEAGKHVLPELCDAP